MYCVVGVIPCVPLYKCVLQGIAIMTKLYFKPFDQKPDLEDKDYTDRVLAWSENTHTELVYRILPTNILDKCLEVELWAYLPVKPDPPYKRKKRILKPLKEGQSYACVNGCGIAVVHQMSGHPAWSECCTEDVYIFDENGPDINGDAIYLPEE